jgi:flagellar assembly protein FliH
LIEPPMAHAQKFLFETDFDQQAAEEEAAAAEPPPPTFSEADVANARLAGFAEGRAAGIAETQATVERSAAQALAAIAGKLSDIGQAIAADLARREHEAIEIAVAIARRAVPTIANQHATAAVEELVRENLPSFSAEPRIIVRTAERVLETVKTRLSGQLAASGYAGKLVVVGEPALSAPDCKLEWTDGGAEIDTAGVWQRVDEAVARYVSSQPPDPKGNAAARSE